MGFFFRQTSLIFLFTLIQWASGFASDLSLSLVCLLKEGEGKEIPINLSLTGGEPVETTVSSIENSKQTYRVQAKLQEVVVLEQSRIAIDYEIEKTEDGKKLKKWKFPREFIAKNSSFQIQIKGKTPLQMSCKNSGATE